MWIGHMNSPLEEPDQRHLAIHGTNMAQRRNGEEAQLETAEVGWDASG
jgi:hypothetical protein